MGLPREVSSDKKERQNSWQQTEETLLFGAICEKWFSTGALHPARGGENKGKVWETIKKIHDKMKSNLKSAKIENVGVDRTFSALERHYKVMKKKYAKDEKDKDSSRLCLGDIYRMYEYKVKEMREKYGIVLFSQEDMDEIIPEIKGSSKDIVSAGRKNSWKKEEERLLVYCAFQKFIEKGSFNSAKSDGDDLCWESILKLFQQGLKYLYPNESNTRTANALSRHFRVMKKDEWKRKSNKTLKQLYQECVEEFSKRPLKRTFGGLSPNMVPFQGSGLESPFATELKPLLNMGVHNQYLNVADGVILRKRDQHEAMLQQIPRRSVSPSLRASKGCFTSAKNPRVFAPMSLAPQLTPTFTQPGTAQLIGPTSGFAPPATYAAPQMLLSTSQLNSATYMSALGLGTGLSGISPSASRYPGIPVGQQNNLFNSSGLFNGI
mmetsp:Transcript_4380/g.5082  ORF Transcript_4380/g.5082 Transcript_4380/m.5082 type:complete len:436 (+) Transcript_4380:379-1686(+)|eukprot:CAMPEP_0184019068 /NCGR_PEP_ID=MMETSP0954-20121128/8533_1 /TAXON_ID=627963 /ORGANISM="Aplanochytrium sp, Strain PBS07" /LENGTH=435 /DNA_ID=CAMNT_0026300667 /DNA_START=352 /DNA_END=1659 /DNA_ORIENTATION=+